jgi:HEAT repeat protein
MDQATRVAELVNQLGHQAFGERRDAAHALSKMWQDAAPALPALLGRLKDKYACVREQAARAIGRLGPAAAAAMPDLIPLLSDKSVCVRTQTAYALGKLGPLAAPAIPDLLPLLQQRNERVRDQVTDTLRKIGQDAAPAVPVLLRWLAGDLSGTGIDLDDPLAPLASWGLPLKRRTIVQIIGRIGPGATAAVPALRQIVGDTKESLELKQDAETALERIEGIAVDMNP